MTDDTRLDRDHDDLDVRQRPQSRASQHSTLAETSNGRRGPEGTNLYNRNNPAQISPYQFQQSQFDEPGRAGDDVMW